MKPPSDRPDLSPREVSSFFRVCGREQETWGPAELKDVLLHQLRSPLEYDLATVAGAGGPTVAELSTAGSGPRLETFGQLLRDAHPPMELVRLLKDYAKAARANGSLPVDVATVLYYGSLALAATRCGQRIGKLDDAALRKGLRWCLRQDWLDDTTRAVLAEAAQKMGLA